MSALILDGTKTACQIRAELQAEVSSMQIKPKLVVVLVGDDPASKVYVGMKEKGCREIGMLSEKHVLPGNTPEAALLALIDRLNADPSVDGILCQLPLPKHISEHNVLERIAIQKDVDCFHPMNVGYLATGNPFVKPCTPAGVIEIMKRHSITMKGAHAVVVGRSNIVGKPLAQLLLAEHATVTICHSRTNDLPAVCRSADILCAAIGKPEIIKGDWIKKGAVVIDVGVNRVDDASLPKGYKLVGDVAYNEASQVASYITPVPGGIGPMTIAMLLSNTLELHKKRISL
ncbi:MAG: bifunctional methylenetetrahydrofolate dehydrogenase/methenyltetrahydrofolate cyclohydrolase FolD [Spirochaetes bacterium]|nr:bifunctional methylenetetrahydrofolate dehydrogenase/methenyltetrahydrofolate cyclohydrolase FolD [Spirochaetota bacterium]